MSKFIRADHSIQLPVDLAWHFHQNGEEVVLEGQSVLITGAASSIGAATAELFAAKGATIIVANIAAQAGEILLAQLGAKHRFVHLDVSDSQE